MNECTQLLIKYASNTISVDFYAKKDVIIKTFFFNSSNQEGKTEGISKLHEEIPRT